MEKTLPMAVAETTPARLSKHEIRTRETRALLLQAAETIFNRDGYEGAELGEIAALAGRTKGAIYGHFKSKEDIFLALVEEQRFRYRLRMEELLSTSDTVAGNVAAMQQFLAELAADERWALLSLEFKLFAIRHPESQERLRDYYVRVMADQEPRYVELLGPAGDGEKAFSRTVVLRVMTPILAALLLERQFDSGLLGPETTRNLIERVFAALIETR